MAHRYWRLKAFITTSNDFVAMGEAWFLDGSDAKLTPALITASSTWGTLVPSRLMDDNAATIWHSNSASPETEWVVFDYGVPVDAIKIAVTAGSDSGSRWQMAPYNFDVDYSDDGSTWTTLANVSYPNTFTNGMTQTVSMIPGPSYPQVSQIAVVAPLVEGLPLARVNQVALITPVVIQAEEVYVNQVVSIALVEGPRRKVQPLKTVFQLPCFVPCVPLASKRY